MADHFHAGLVDDLARSRGVVMLVGARDTGKSTFARHLLQAAAASGTTGALVDADVDQTTVGPPACVGVRLHPAGDDPAAMIDPDRLHFVGAIDPERVVLQQVVATAALTSYARAQADLVVVDTTGVISGVAGETLKYHKMELCRPEVVVAFQRGAEAEPLAGMLRRFFGAEVVMAAVDPEVRPSDPERRRALRTGAFAAALGPPLQKWRVRDTVFAPTLPEGLDLSRLDGVLVGLQDGTGTCLGLGVLEHDDGGVRVATKHGEGMRGLRLGTLRIDPETFETRPVRLGHLMFGV